MNEYFNSKVDEGISRNIVCPEQCGTIIHQNEIVKWLDEERYNKFFSGEQNMIKIENKEEGEIWKDCPNKDGWGTFYLPGTPTILCHKCNTLICTTCELAHDPSKFNCDDFKKSLGSEEEQDRLAKEFIMGTFNM